METPGKRIVPLFVVISITLEVVTLCLRNWIEGYYGDVNVLTMCPWRVCHLNCLGCEGSKPKIGCSWIQNWSGTGFETFEIVAHLEYWTIGILTVGLLSAALDWTHSHISDRTGCSVDLSKPTLLILIVGSLLSTLSVSLFGAKIRPHKSSITTVNNIDLHFAWPYVLRVISAVLAWGATVTSIYSQCVSSARSQGDPGESVMIITSVNDYDDDSSDEAENGVLL